MAAAALTAGALPVLGPVPAAADGSCQVDYDVVNGWDGGFQADISITAGNRVDGWDISWDFPADTAVTSAWNVDWNQTGTTFTGSDVGWNARIGAGETVRVFGFVGSGSTVTPEGISVNGTLCDGQTPPTPDPTPSPTPTDPPTDPPGDPVRIMPLGDSITGSPGCWRGNLWQLVTDAGYDVDFVGSQYAGCAPAGADLDHEGHGGALVTNVVASGETRTWLEQNTPDVVLLHFGTNDVWSNVPPSQILDAYSSIVADLRELNPDATVLAAQIIPLEPDASFGCTDCAQRAVNLNAQIPAWAASLSTAESPIVVVDQWTGFDASNDAYDGVHPNDSGNVKIAARWFDALDDVLS
ncbi:cellulose-binding protein [Myceligenerans sp. I2]|uniref:Cellulose-binding protein n=2 Tax=Myceligenerans indicum TaxID=2593663 RepID=A0ABS1LME8_9MICO|nr:cellulose-binding protein [Myceligenerans indicum]